MAEQNELRVFVTNTDGEDLFIGTLTTDRDKTLLLRSITVEANGTPLIRFPFALTEDAKHELFLKWEPNYDE